MIRSEVGKPRGVLRGQIHDERRFQHVRLAPSSDLSRFVAHFWIVAWDLRGQKPFLAQTLPHPAVHLVIEARRAEVGGVSTGRFSRRLHGQGRVFGIKFRPAAFQPIFGAPMHRLTDRKLPVRELFGAAGSALVRAIRGERDERRCVGLAEAFLRERAPRRDATVERVRDLVERMASDPELARVEQVATLARCDRRTLQRLFRSYVGVSPKWVLQRYRLHEAAEQIADGSAGSIADLALRLGYFDQAHFIRDFKAIVGRPPGAYAEAIAQEKRVRR